MYLICVFTGYFEMLKSYFQETLKNMETRIKSTILKEVKASKKSILYDFKKRMDLLSQSLINSGIETTLGRIEEEKRKLETSFPIKDLETFTSFEEIIKADEVKEKAFVSKIYFKF